jgi:hypothetical protein
VLRRPEYSLRRQFEVEGEPLVGPGFGAAIGGGYVGGEALILGAAVIELRLGPIAERRGPEEVSLSLAICDCGRSCATFRGMRKLMPAV